MYYKKHVFVCTNQKAEGKVCCANAGGEDTFHYLKKKLVTQGLHGVGEFRVSKSGCLGRCEQGPCLVIYPEGVWYSCKSTSDIDEIVDTHLLTDNKVKRLLIDQQHQINSG